MTNVSETVAGGGAGMDGVTRLEAVAAKVRALARRSAAVRERLAGSVQAFTELCERTRIAREAPTENAIRAVLASGRLSAPKGDPNTGMMQSLAQRIALPPGEARKWKAMLAKEIRSEAFERTVAAALLGEIDRIAGADEAECQRERAATSTGRHESLSVTIEYWVGHDWPADPPDPRSHSAAELARLPDEDLLTVAAYRLAGLADLGVVRPLVPEPIGPAALENFPERTYARLRWPVPLGDHERPGVRPDPSSLDPSLAQTLWDHLQNWAREQCGAGVAGMATDANQTATDPTAPVMGDGGGAGADTTTRPGGGPPKWVRSSDASKRSGLSANAILRRSKREEWRVMKSGRMNCYLLSDLERAWPDKNFRPIKGEL